jgi:hypothetical protein
MTKIAPSLKAAAEAKDDDSVNKSLPTFMVDPRAVVVIPEFNARPIDADHVAKLKGLRRSGVDLGFYTLQMIDGKPALRDGHHRHAADMELIAEGFDIKKVKAIEFKGDEKAAILFMLATGSNLAYTPLQLGEQYSKLVNTFGMSYREIAESRGMSEQHVKDSIRLTEQPVELKQMITSGQIAPATALKLVKKEGVTEAISKIKQAAAVPGIKVGKPITQKALDNLGSSFVSEAAKNGEACAKHLSAMLESPGFDTRTKAVLRDVLTLVQGKKEAIVQKPGEVVRAWLDERALDANSRISEAASLMRDVVDKKKVDEPNSPGAKNYGHMIWLQKLAETHPKVTVRAASHWYCAVLEAQNSSRELAPAPSVLPLDDALRAEMDSGGTVLAETLCPEQTDLITWARGRV